MTPDDVVLRIRDAFEDIGYVVLGPRTVGVAVDDAVLVIDGEASVTYLIAVKALPHSTPTPKEKDNGDQVGSDPGA